MNTETKSEAFFDKASNRIIDGVVIRDGIRYGQYGGKTLEQMQFDYGGEIVVMDSEEAYKLYLQQFIKPVEETTKEYWWQMLEVLPPVNWVRAGSSESFKLSERTAGNITLIMVRVGDQYFKLEDDIRLPHAEIVQRVVDYLESKTAPEGAAPTEQAGLSGSASEDTN